MSIFDQHKVKHVIMVLSAAALTLGTTACSTTDTVKITKSVPISYKAGKGATQYASLNMPQASQTPYTRQQYAAPQPSIPQASIPQAVPQQSYRPATPVFDQSRIDRELYKHQGVGKTYTIMGKSYTPEHEPDYNVVGTASWYGDKFHGKPTATGEIYNKNDITAAHKTLPLNSMLYVTNIENGRTLMVRLNDRGPFIGDRIIDLSEAAAIALGTKGQGLGQVRVQYAGPADPMAAKDGVPAPQPRYEEAPQVVEAPQIPEYRSLREQPMAQAPVPYSAPLPQYETPQVAAPIAPQQPQAVAPGAQPEDGGQVTLTIKGPIHVAGYDDTYAQPRMVHGPVPTK